MTIIIKKEEIVSEERKDVEQDFYHRGVNSPTIEDTEKFLRKLILNHFKKRQKI